MNKLTGRITSDSSLAAFLSENTRAAFRVAGAMDRDHQQLAILEDEVNRTVVLVERLLKELSEDIQRHTNFVATERRNLNTCLLYTSPSPRDRTRSRMPSSA